MAMRLRIGLILSFSTDSPASKLGEIEKRNPNILFSQALNRKGLSEIVIQGLLRLSIFASSITDFRFRHSLSRRNYSAYHVLPGRQAFSAISGIPRQKRRGSAEGSVKSMPIPNTRVRCFQSVALKALGGRSDTRQSPFLRSSRAECFPY